MTLSSSQRKAQIGSFSAGDGVVTSKRHTHVFSWRYHENYIFVLPSPVARYGIALTLTSRACFQTIIEISPHEAYGEADVA